MFQILKPLPTTFSSVSVVPAVPNNSKWLVQPHGHIINTIYLYVLWWFHHLLCFALWIKHRFIHAGVEHVDFKSHFCFCVFRSEGSLTDSGSPDQSSEINSGPSSLSCVDVKPAHIKAGVQDALSKAFAQIMPMTSINTSQLSHSNRDSGLFSASFDPCGFRPDHSNSPGSTDFDNMTYSIRIPNCPHPIIRDSSEVQTQAKMICASAYHLRDKTVTSAEPQIQVASLMTTDMSYQECSTDSVTAVDSSLSSFSTGINAIVSCDPLSRAQGGYKSFDDVVQHS